MRFAASQQAVRMCVQIGLSPLVQLMQQSRQMVAMKDLRHRSLRFVEILHELIASPRRFHHTCAGRCDPVLQRQHACLAPTRGGYLKTSSPLHEVVAPETHGIGLSMDVIMGGL
jgi:hypothetical protein